MNEEGLKKRIERERKARAAAEEALETKSRELYEANQALQNSALSLEEAQKRLSSILRSVPSGIFTVVEDGQIIRMNAAAAAYLGLSESDFDEEDILKESLSVFEFFSSESETQTIIKSLFENGSNSESDSLEVNALSRNGEEFPIELAVAPISDSKETETPQNVQSSNEQVWAFREIARRKHAENTKEQQRLQLEQQLALFDAAINSMDQGLAVYDENHDLVVCNQPYVDLYRLSEDLTKPGVNYVQILEHRATFDMIPDRDLEKVKQEKDDLLITGEGELKSYAMLNGQTIEVSNQIMPQGGWLSTHRDITKKLKTEEKKRQEEQEESQAQKLEALGTLASGVAHEINTPVQYVSDNVRFLQDSISDILELLDLYESIKKHDAVSENAADIVEKIDAKIEEMDLEFVREELDESLDQSLEGLGQVGSIVKAIKEFSHPGEEGKSTLDINKAIEMTATVSRNQWKYVAELETDLDPDIPVIAGYPSDINQVLLNMVVNAADAITECEREGMGKIAIRTSSCKDHVRIEICDTGCGIPDEIADKIYDPFFTTKDIGKGSGQGLAICFSIIQTKHNGSITFRSIKGQGTGFVIKLPIKTPKEMVAEDRDNVEDAA